MRSIARHFLFRAIRVSAALLAVLAASSTFAVQIFVAGSAPRASDQNPGTEARPLKTIQAAVDTAQPGDNVEVRAGVYHEGIKFKRSGTCPLNGRISSSDPGELKMITLEAYKDEHVVLDGAATIPADKWELVKGRKNTYWTPFESEGNRRVNVMFREGTLILPTLKNIPGADSSLIAGSPCNIMPAMPDDTPDKEGYYHDQKEKKLFVNLGGCVPGKGAECKAAALISGVDAVGQSYVRIRKLEVRNFLSYGLFMDYGREFVVEDNHIHHCGSGLWGANITGSVIRRNTITDITSVAVGVSGERGLIAEGNVIQRSNQNPYKVVAWDGSAVVCNGAMGLVLRNNVIMGGPDISAFWSDCGGVGAMLYGNTTVNSGFYIEMLVCGTLLRWNTVADSGSGIAFARNSGNMAFENYLFRNHGGLSIGACDDASSPQANLMMRNWVIDNGRGACFAPNLSKQPAHVFDHNVYKFQDWPDVDLRGRKPAASKIDKSVNVGMTTDNWPGTNLRGQFWARWTGGIKTEKAGAYKFRVKTHEFNGARLFLDNKQVVCSSDAKVPASSREREYQLQLASGDHEIMLEFYHGLVDNLWKSCILSWQPPGGVDVLIPENALFHKESGAAELQPGLKAEFFHIRNDPLPVDPTNKAVILQYGSRQYKDIQSLRAEVGQEAHGKVVTEFDPAPLGLVTFRVHGAKKSWEPLSMFGNPGPDRFDIVESGEPYFWKKGSSRSLEDYGWHSPPGSIAYGPDPTAGCGFLATTRADESGFVRMYLSRDFWDSIHQFDDPTAGRPGSAAYLQVGAIPGKTISADGFGYWSTSLPTTDGAQIDLSLQARAKNVKAAKHNGGLYAVVEFCDETGQNVTRQYVVGADPPVNADFMTGDHLHKPVKMTVTAPRGARWFKLGFGLRNCTGWVSFNDIDIKTRPGAPEAEVAKALPIDAGKFAWTPCDLSRLLNRPLDDDVDNDGKGGWTDQGPAMDLRGLQAGDYTWNKAAFRVENGKACFIMKNRHRPSQNLPADGKVELKGKADVLALLHTGAWIEQGVRQSTYIIHYTDGSKVEIPVVGGKNILDWTAPVSRSDEVKYDPALGLILPATSVPSLTFVHVTVWMVLWKSPHPEKEIATLEVKGENQGIPGLIAVSFGVAK